MQWFLKVQLGSGGPGVEIYMGLTTTYSSFRIFIGFFFQCYIKSTVLLLQPVCKVGFIPDKVPVQIKHTEMCHIFSKSLLF